MPKKIIALDITGNMLVAVQVKSLLQGYQISECFAVPVTEAGGVEVALRAVLLEIDSRGASCYAMLPAGKTSFRNVDLPFADLKKIRQVLAFELETRIPVPVDELVTDFIVAERGAASTDLLVAAAAKEFLAGFIDMFVPHGLDPEVIDIRNIALANLLLRQGDTPDNGLLLYIGIRKATVVYFLNRQVVLVRQVGFNGQELAAPLGRVLNREQPGILESATYNTALESLCKTLQITLKGYAVETGKGGVPEKVFVTGPGSLVRVTSETLQKCLDLPVSSTDMKSSQNIQISEGYSRIWNPALMDNALALAMRDAKQERGFNFRRDEFQVKTQFVKFKKELLHAAIFLVVFLCFLGGNLGIEYNGLKKRNDDMDSNIREVFTGTFPEITRVVEPVHQMKTKIEEVKTVAGSVPGINTKRSTLSLLSDISARTPADLEVQVDRMVIDQDSIQLTGTTDTFNTVDSIKKGLEQSSNYKDVTIASANLDRSGKGVRFEIKMQRLQ